MTNPFDDPDVHYTVLANAEGQHSLWPVAREIPAGWKRVHGPADRESCLDHVRKTWTDLRPRSVAAAQAI